MNQLLKVVFIIAALLLATIAIITIWTDTIPEALGRVFVTVLVVGLTLVIVQPIITSLSKRAE